MTVVALEAGALGARDRPVLGRVVAQQFRVEELRAGHGHDLEQAVGRGQHDLQVAEADPDVLGAVLPLIVHHDVVRRRVHDGHGGGGRDGHGHGQRRPETGAAAVSGHGVCAERRTRWM